MTSLLAGVSQVLAGVSRVLAGKRDAYENIKVESKSGRGTITHAEKDVLGDAALTQLDNDLGGGALGVGAILHTTVTTEKQHEVRPVENLASGESTKTNLLFLRRNWRLRGEAKGLQHLHRVIIHGRGKGHGNRSLAIGGD